MGKEGERYRNLRHHVAVRIHDLYMDGEKVEKVEEQLDFFLAEAFNVLICQGQVTINAKDL